jgi:hypothetical protein
MGIGFQLLQISSQTAKILEDSNAESAEKQKPGEF